uniref:hypothetical protein n=1 Tax=Enterocloster clostridioformis TaxID=1531 RepID=UPI002ED2EE35
MLAGKYIAEHVDSPRWREIRGENAPGLLLVCNAGEEGLGNLKGVHKICEDFGDRIERFCTFDSSLSSIVDRAVGSKRFRVRVRTRGGHSYDDFGNDNAIAGLASLVGKLYGIRVPEGEPGIYGTSVHEGD